MQQASTFTGWDLATSGGSNAVWRIYEGHTAPLLRAFMTNLTLAGAPDVAVTYNGNVQSGASIAAPAGVFGAAASGTNAGFYNGYYSTQQGYDLTGGNLTINAIVLSAISLNGTRVYDGTTDVAAGIFTLSGLINNEDLLLTGVGTIGSKNVGTYNVNLGSLALGDGSTGLASNYTFAGGTQTAIITKADLTISTGAVSKTYDGIVAAAGTAIVTGGAMFGSDSISGGSFAFADKNAGSGNKTVTTSGVSVNDGNGGGNYAISYIDNVTSSILAKAIASVGGLGAIDKVYDGTATATLDLGGASFGDMIVGDDLSVGSATASFSDKNAGSGKTVTVSGITLAGDDAGNYTLPTPPPASRPTSASAVSPSMRRVTTRSMTATRRPRPPCPVATRSWVDDLTFAALGHVRQQERRHRQNRHCQRHHPWRG